MTSARFDFSALEINLLVMMIRSINVHGKDNDFYQFNIDLRSLKSQSATEIKGSRIKRALKSLQTKLFEFENNGHWISVQLIGGVQLTKNEQRIYFDISPFIKPLLFNLKSFYTQFELESIFKLSSKYAKRIYPMACQFKGSGVWAVKVSELHNRLKLPDSYRENFGMMKLRVLNAAIREINDLTDIKIQESSQIKQPGTKIVHSIVYSVSYKSPELRTDNERKLIDSLEKLGLTSWQAVNVILSLEATEIRKLIWNIQLKKSNNAIDGSVGSYSIGCFKNAGVQFEKKQTQKT